MSIFVYLFLSGVLVGVTLMVVANFIDEKIIAHRRARYEDEDSHLG